MTITARRIPTALMTRPAPPIRSDRARFAFLPLTLAITVLTAFLTPERAHAQRVGGVELRELTIERAHSAMRAGTLTTRDLVVAYLRRIDAYDRNGPSLNAILRLNPRALERADSLDARFGRTGRLSGPLHGVPFIVKDNYDTHDMPTTAGSAALEGSVPADDAHQVRRIREAGAIVLAKSNMAEFAFTPYETIGSALPGYTFNPYALNRVPAGSSGGTAAAIAANFGLVGLGTDTGNSIRGPASHTALVGVRSTQGLTSRDGIVPLSATRDVGGPLARTVEDAVRVLDVIAGTDSADAVTAEADDRRAKSYLDAMGADLTGVRIGVVGQLAYTRTADPEVLARFTDALDTLRALGAGVATDFRIPDLDDLREGLGCSRFRHDLERYLATLPDPPVRTLRQIEESGEVHVTVMPRIRGILSRDSVPPDEDERCREAARNEERLRDAVRSAMDSHDVQALVYPTWNNPPRLIGDLTTPHGNNSQALSPPTGFPAMTVPMGFVRNGALPTGLQIMGKAWDEATLIRIARAFERVTGHRRPPDTTPPLQPGG
ncbi:MAG: amidase [Gemmatimonadota bacterium]|nr:amidase [Gemmatimonadota bacterium]